MITYLTVTTTVLKLESWRVCWVNIHTTAGEVSPSGALSAGPWGVGIDTDITDGKTWWEAEIGLPGMRANDVYGAGERGVLLIYALRYACTRC
jgi:hypothetical protein